MVNYLKGVTAFLALFAISQTAHTQSCDNPLSLCGGSVEIMGEFFAADFTGSAVEPCFTGDSWAVARFHTTYINTTEGVSVHVQNSCGNHPMKVMVVLPDALDFCDATQFTAVSECTTVASSASIITDDLYSNTDYLVLFGFDSTTAPADCTWSIEVAGTPLTIDACCPTNIDYDESAELQVVGADPNVGHQWEPSEFVDNPTGSTVQVSPDATTMFTVSGFVESCEYYDNVLVTVGAPINVPNSFSPNGDMINDTWDVTGLDYYQGSIINLYDRWGQQILRHVGNISWDGTVSGKDAPIGTYYYVIQINHMSANLEPLTGNIALIR